jgi:hypothetical protein
MLMQGRVWKSWLSCGGGRSRCTLWYARVLRGFPSCAEDAPNTCGWAPCILKFFQVMPYKPRSQAVATWPVRPSGTWYCTSDDLKRVEVGTIKQPNIFRPELPLESLWSWSFRNPPLKPASKGVSALGNRVLPGPPECTAGLDIRLGEKVWVDVFENG